VRERDHDDSHAADIDETSEKSKPGRYPEAGTRNHVVPPAGT